MRDWLSHRVASSPDDVALVRAEDGEAWTYDDLDRLVTETAGRLVAHGIGEGDRVGVLTPPYVGTVGLVHAAMRIGATFVPLGERLTPRELSERIKRADLSAIVCAESTESDALAAVDDVPVLSVDEPTEASVTAVHGVDPAPVDPPEWTFDDRLCILFTSGTTGASKPVPLTAGNVYSSAVASAFRLGVEPADRWLVALALTHMGGLAPVYRSTLYGTTLVLRTGFDPGGTADDIDRYDVTGVSLVPTMLKRMLDSRGTLADSLRVVLLGGAPASDELIERCRDYSIPVYPTYGMTEAASQIATATPRQTRDRLGTVGRPLFGTDVTVVDDGAPVDPGETGEIVVDGPTITPGYIGPDATGSAFGEHGLHTGDVGRLDEDGYLFVLNRVDDRIISGAENVEPGEVADVLREIPAVEDAAIVGLDDDDLGERVSALIAVGEATPADHAPETADRDHPNADATGADERDPNGGTADDRDGDGSPADDRDGDGSPADETAEPPERIDDDELLSFARERLAGFKIPRTIAYTDELPRTVSGTVDRDVVRERLVEDGYEIRDGFGSAGFEPATPKPAHDDGDESDDTAGDAATDWTRSDLTATVLYGDGPTASATGRTGNETDVGSAADGDDAETDGDDARTDGDDAETDGDDAETDGDD